MTAVEGLSALARDHLENPRGRDAFPPDVPGEISRGEAGSAASGAFLRFCLRIVEGRIVQARYEVLGPPELMAAASWFSESLIGRRVAADAVPPGMEAARALELPRATHGLTLLAEDAVRAALKCAL
ncbi:MAG: iron-sulfur cluster assembly scaffold protein [Gammaproteobacteria bacterium]